jgi:hypothetical protein
VKGERWLFLAQGKRHGFYDLDGLIEQLLTLEEPGETLVWREGLDSWRAASSVPELTVKLPPPVPQWLSSENTVDQSAQGRDLGEPIEPSNHDDGHASPTPAAALPPREGASAPPLLVQLFPDQLDFRDSFFDAIFRKQGLTPYVIVTVVAADALASWGIQRLPAVVIDDELVMQGRWPHPQEVTWWAERITDHRSRAPGTPFRLMPRTLSDAVSAVLDRMSASDKKALAETRGEELSEFHRTWGMGIRNSYGLFDQNAELLKSCRAGDADEASSVIIREVWKRLADPSPAAAGRPSRPPTSPPRDAAKDAQSSPAGFPSSSQYATQGMFPQQMASRHKSPARTGDPSPRRHWSLRFVGPDEAVAAVKESAIVFYIVAGLQTLASALVGPSSLVDAAVFAVLGLWLHLGRSRVAATLLLLAAVASVPMTLANVAGLGLGGGKNIVLALLTTWAGLRAVAATYQLPRLLSVRKRLAGPKVAAAGRPSDRPLTPAAEFEPGSVSTLSAAVNGVAMFIFAGMALVAFGSFLFLMLQAFAPMLR